MADDTNILDLTTMGSVTVPVQRAANAIETSLLGGFDVRIVVIPRTDGSVIVYCDGVDCDEFMGLL